jgi:hypothetical protein
MQRTRERDANESNTLLTNFFIFMSQIKEFKRQEVDRREVYEFKRQEVDRREVKKKAELKGPEHALEMHHQMVKCDSSRFGADWLLK